MHKHTLGDLEQISKIFLSHSPKSASIEDDEDEDIEIESVEDKSDEDAAAIELVFAILVFGAVMAESSNETSR